MCASVAACEGPRENLLGNGPLREPWGWRQRGEGDQVGGEGAREKACQAQLADMEVLVSVV